MTDEQLATYIPAAARMVCAVKDADAIEIKALFDRLDKQGPAGTRCSPGRARTRRRPHGTDPAGGVMSRSIREHRDTCPCHLHDTYAARKAGCTCPAAREAFRLYQKRLATGRNTPRLVAPTGTRRRIQALAAMGYTFEFQAREIGWKSGDLSVLFYQRKSAIYEVTATAVAEMYDRLCMTSGPSSRTRRIALAKGWPPPLAWDDDTIDDPQAEPVGMQTYQDSTVPPGRLDEDVVEDVIAGISVRLSRAETDAAVDRLTGRGLTDSTIAERLGVTPRTVSRSKARLRNQNQRADTAA